MVDKFSGVIRNRFQKGFWWEGSSETVYKTIFGQKPFPKGFLVGGVIRNRFQNGFWWEGSSETVSKRVFGGRGDPKPFPKRVFDQKPFPKWFLVGGVIRNRFQRGFWWERSSETVSKMVFGGRGHHKPFPKGFLVGGQFPKGFLVGGIIRNRFQKGFLWEGSSETVYYLAGKDDQTK
jgi:hypothetical protein